MEPEKKIEYRERSNLDLLDVMMKEVEFIISLFFGDWNKKRSIRVEQNTYIYQQREHNKGQLVFIEWIIERDFQYIDFIHNNFYSIPKLSKINFFFILLAKIVNFIKFLNNI